MRVISGSAKGHRLVSLEGVDTRPTADRVKEAVFSIIQGHFPCGNVLDLFAGSGGLGIEALSRGARYADFVDSNRNAINVVKQNLTKTKFTNSASLHNVCAEKFLHTTDKKYDIIFLDPPYHQGLCDIAIDIIGERKLLTDSGIIVCETAAEEEVSAQYSENKCYKYGSTKILICGG